MQRFQILGVPIDDIKKEEALERCRGFLRDGKQHQITTINPEFVVEAQKNDTFKKILQGSALALADGMGIVIASLLQGRNIERITGVDFLIELCAFAEREQASVFLLGGKGGAAQRTAEVLKKRFKELNITGWSEDEGQVPAGNFDIIFAAFGAPKQELWIAENLAKMPRVKIAMGAGGAFDMLSGKIKRAPQFMRSLGLEWVWRFMAEPRRIRRIFTATFRFAFEILRAGR